MKRSPTRRSFIAAAGTLTLAGCLDAGSNESTPEAPPTATPATGTDPGQSTTKETRWPPTASETLPLPMAPETLQERAISGGPPKDGIPSIDDPSFVDPAGGDAFLDPGDPVFGLAMGGERKAYPQNIMVSHEICNDIVDGRPVSVTYCPLTGTAMGFERGETTFGVSGRLVNNNLIMYDRATETWWPQVLATSIPGLWNDSPSTASLREFRLIWTTWENWQSVYPETQVLSRDTGFPRSYEIDPYGSYNPRGGYYARESTLFDPAIEDDRHPTKDVFHGVRTASGASAVHERLLRTERVVTGTAGDVPVAFVHDGVLDTDHVYRLPGADAAVPRPIDGGYRLDGETYAADDLPLDPVQSFDAMWFAWFAFYPSTEVHA